MSEYYERVWPLFERSARLLTLGEIAGACGFLVVAIFITVLILRRREIPRWCGVLTSIPLFFALVAQIGYGAMIRKAISATDILDPVAGLYLAFETCVAGILESLILVILVLIACRMSAKRDGSSLY